MGSLKKIVALTGAGISAESGLATFRGSNGLWNGYDIMEVASIHGWRKDRAKVLEFYNFRRREALNALPNEGHKLLAQLEQYADVTIITQNVDDLHEKAGSSQIIHLHGELFKSRSTADEQLVYPVKGTELKLGDLCEKGSQLRPHIVWFGEEVPMMELAAEVVSAADVFLVVGTSLQVYPAASLIHYVDDSVPKFVIDPEIPEFAYQPNTEFIQATASQGMKILYDQLLASL